MYKYKQTTNVGDLVIWTNPSVRIVANKPHRVISTGTTLVEIKDESNTTSQYGSVSRKTLFTKPADQAVVGDYMYRVSSGNPKFPQYSTMKITKIDAKSNISNLYYASTSSVSFNEVIVIAQAEPEITYPLFKEDIQLGFIFKYTGPNEGIYLTNKGVPNRKPGEYLSTMSSENNAWWKPCDFTTEPEVFDLDWWQQRFEARLPVYYVGNNGYCTICHLPPKEWEPNTIFSMTDNSPTQKVPMSKEDIELFKQQVPLSSLHLGLCQEISLGAAADCSLPYTIIQKEKPMKFQDFINSLFTAEIKTDYEKKPNFLVTIYNSEGTEIAVTTATSVKSVEDILQSSPKLWGSKAVMYSIDSEVQVSVPVITTKFKKPKEEK